MNDDTSRPVFQEGQNNVDVNLEQIGTFGTENLEHMQAEPVTQGSAIPTATTSFFPIGFSQATISPGSVSNSNPNSSVPLANWPYENLQQQTSQGQAIPTSQYLQAAGPSHAPELTTYPQQQYGQGTPLQSNYYSPGYGSNEGTSGSFVQPYSARMVVQTSQAMSPSSAMDLSTSSLKRSRSELENQGPEAAAKIPRSSLKQSTSVSEVLSPQSSGIDITSPSVLSSPGGNTSLSDSRPPSTAPPTPFDPLQWENPSEKRLQITSTEAASVMPLSSPENSPLTYDSRPPSTSPTTPIKQLALEKPSEHQMQIAAAAVEPFKKPIETSKGKKENLAGSSKDNDIELTEYPRKHYKKERRSWAKVPLA